MSPDDSAVLFLRAPKGLDRKRLRQFAATLQRDVTGGRPFECLFTDDTELQRLNREFLQHDYPTDVLSFPSGEADGAVGEFAVSCTRAAAQAAEFGHPLSDELCILMLHGALHLAGWDHVGDRGRMRREETRLRQLYQLPTGLIERARR